MDKREELLRKLRGHLAFKASMEPFRVFRDEELFRLLDKEPKTLEELSQIKGFPKDGKRYSAYGQSIIDIFNKTDKIDDFRVSVDENGEPISTTVLQKLKLY